MLVEAIKKSLFSFNLSVSKTSSSPKVIPPLKNIKNPFSVESVSFYKVYLIFYIERGRYPL